MHHRYDRINLPIEIIRTIVTIAETGSFSKAAERLGLSQPAISSQVKRLQQLIGGALFERSGGGVTLTPLGELLHSHARKLLDANDQILMLGGTDGVSQPLRLGIATIFIKHFMAIISGDPISRAISIYCAHSVEVAKAMADGFIDVACLLNAPSAFGEPVARWEENLSWVRSREFVLSPGAPIPLICWPGSSSDQPMIQALEKNGLSYRVVFTSTDHYARDVAAAAGFGVMTAPERHVVEPLVVAKDYYLPPIEPLTAEVHVRTGVSASKADTVVKLLRRLGRVEGRRNAA